MLFLKRPPELHSATVLQIALCIVQPLNNVPMVAVLIREKRHNMAISNKAND